MRKQAWSTARAQLVLDEANKRVESSARRLASVDQRLGVLIGSGAIAGTLATATSTSTWLTVALGLIGVSTVLGLVGTLPTRGYAELPWAETRTELWREPDVAAVILLADRRVDLANQRELQIRAKACWLRLGYVMLGAAVLTLCLSAALASPDGEEQGRQPAPTATPS